MWCRALISFLILQPRATLKFPLGEVSLEERDDEEVKKALSINGILKGQILNGVCTAQYKDEDLKLRYIYKVCILKKFDIFFLIIPCDTSARWLEVCYCTVPFWKMVGLFEFSSFLIFPSFLGFVFSNYIV